MGLSLALHLASEDERRQAYLNVHDVWNGGLSLEEHLRRRLKSVQHNRARWFVGCLDDGRVVTSLGCYPMQFNVDGNMVEGIAIGAVHTVAEFRGQGFAPQLIDYVEQHSRDEGCQLSMLYSDINPDYYTRRGYQLCPAWEGWIDPATIELDESDAKFELEQFDAKDHVDAITAMYQSDHSRFSVSIHKDRDYFEFLIARAPNDEFFWLLDNAENAVGYIRLKTDGMTIRIVDLALADRNESTLAAAASAAIRIAHQRSAGSVGGWIPYIASLQRLFKIEPREIELTMLKPLVPSLVIEDRHCADAANFCEIDHI